MYACSCKTCAGNEQEMLQQCRPAGCPNDQCSGYECGDEPDLIIMEGLKDKSSLYKLSDKCLGCLMTNTKFPKTIDSRCLPPAVNGQCSRTDASVILHAVSNDEHKELAYAQHVSNNQLLQLLIFRDAAR
jgi:hypothetical protein